jgi:aquaporin Z
MNLAARVTSRALRHLMRRFRMTPPITNLDTAPQLAVRRPTAAQPRLREEVWGTVARHWPEYLIEAFALGTFMVSACVFTILLEHPASPARQAIASPELRRVLMGVAMALTAVALIYSPWGKRSGAHMNPATTLTFFRLGKIKAVDAAFYAAAQVAGGIAGVALVAAIEPHAIQHPAVHYAATVPGQFGFAAAFLAEFAITFILMTAVLTAIGSKRSEQYAGLIAGGLVASYISVEAPISGMSMNPARTIASAILPGTWTGFWIYATAPAMGMLAAAELMLRLRRGSVPHCAKLHHRNSQRCIFCGANGGI